MKSLLTILLGVLTMMSATAAESKIYERRVYYAPPGKLDDLHARFRNHTLKLFEKHGMENIGYWVPINNPSNKLDYIIAHPSKEAARKSWAAFFADPEWKKAAAESEKNGTLVAKHEVYWLEKTDFSADPKALAAGGPRVFEFRTYNTPPNGRDAINARFRDHTVELFKKHGMINVAYFNLLKTEKEADSTLFYILAHQSEDAAKASFGAFRQDRDWLNARKASEEKAGGSLTLPGGVKSEFFKATDYSPLK